MSNPTGKGGFQERKHHINRRGRPKNFDALRALAQEIAHEEVKNKDGSPAVLNGHKLTNIELVLRSWAQSSDPRKQLAFVEIAFGKVPVVNEVTGKDGNPIEHTLQVFSHTAVAASLETRSTSYRVPSGEDEGDSDGEEMG